MTQGGMKIVIAGAGGRMGRELARAVHGTPGLVLLGGLEAKGSAYVGMDYGALIGAANLGVKISDQPAVLLRQADGLIDFTVPGATMELCKLAAEFGLVHVIGTTGLDEVANAAVRAAAARARIVKSGNFSLGVNLLQILVRKAAATLGDDFDVEVLEMHHKHKVDAPSGTALMLGQAVAAGRGVDLDKKSVRVRDGHTGARKAGDIGFATLRGGGVVGEHSVIFASDAERLELSHKAQSREMFAHGAVRAALWASAQKPGLYDMIDVLGLK